MDGRTFIPECSAMSARPSAAKGAFAPPLDPPAWGGYAPPSTLRGQSSPAPTPQGKGCAPLQSAVMEAFSPTPQRRQGHSPFRPYPAHSREQAHDPQRREAPAQRLPLCPPRRGREGADRRRCGTIGPTVGSYARRALLNAPVPRQGRRPPIERRELGRLLGSLARWATTSIRSPGLKTAVLLSMTRKCRTPSPASDVCGTPSFKPWGASFDHRRKVAGASPAAWRISQQPGRNGAHRDARCAGHDRPDRPWLRHR